jgi:hypothetical protein
MHNRLVDTKRNPHGVNIFSATLAPCTRRNSQFTGVVYFMAREGAFVKRIVACLLKEGMQGRKRRMAAE